MCISRELDCPARGYPARYILPRLFLDNDIIRPSTGNAYSRTPPMPDHASTNRCVRFVTLATTSLQVRRIQIRVDRIEGGESVRISVISRENRVCMYLLLC